MGTSIHVVSVVWAGSLAHWVSSLTGTRFAPFVLALLSGTVYQPKLLYLARGAPLRMPVLFKYKSQPPLEEVAVLHAPFFHSLREARKWLLDVQLVSEV